MLPLFWKALDFNMWISDFEDQQLHSGIQNLWAWIIPLKHSEMTMKYLFWTRQRELTVINCVLLQLISQLWFLSRNSQYETIYRSINITNKMALKDILWLPKTECILLKISLFFFGSHPWPPTVDKTSSNSCLKYTRRWSCSAKLLL